MKLTRTDRNNLKKTFVTLSAFKAESLIRSQRGRFVSVDVIRQDGVFRTMTGRLGVTKYLKGGVSNCEASSNAYMTIYELNVGYRTVNLGTLVEVRAEGKVFSIV